MNSKYEYKLPKQPKTDKHIGPSTEPNFIKVFANFSSDGVQYKSIAIDEETNVGRVLIESLKKYTISECEADDYELFEVIGRESAYGWVEKCSRKLGSYEKPLALQKFFKPQTGFCRKFELRVKEVKRRRNSQLEDAVEAISSLDNQPSNYKTVMMPTEEPYLLLLTGRDENVDKVIYPLNNAVLIVGNDENGCNIRLYSPEVGRRHCWLKVHREDQQVYLSVEPLADCQDPKQPTTDRQYLRELSFEEDLKEYSKEELVERWFTMKREFYDKDDKRFKMNFDTDNVESVLEYTFNLIKLGNHGYKLTPAYILAMTIEYYAIHKEQSKTRQLLLTIAEYVHNEVVNLIDTMAEEYKKVVSDDKIKHLENDLDRLMQWSSNSSEVRFFILQNITQYLMDPSVSLHPEDEHLKNVEERVETLLTEVVLHTIQSLIFYTTRLLYNYLIKTVQVENYRKCQEDEYEEEFSPMISLFQKILQMSERNLIHQDILHQMFEFIFFFTNATLLNEIFKQEENFTWDFGVHLKSRLDLILEWANKNKFQVEVINRMKKLIELSNLLCTSHIVLIRNSWFELKKKCPSLHPAQLNFILKNYQLKNNRKRPDSWRPDNFLLAEDEDLIFETFTNYPTMLIPKRGYVLDLYARIEDKSFYELLSRVPLVSFNDNLITAKYNRKSSKSAINADLTFFSSTTDFAAPIVDEELGEIEKSFTPPEFSCRIRASSAVQANLGVEQLELPSRSMSYSENCFEIPSSTKQIDNMPEVIISSPQPIRPPRLRNHKKLNTESSNVTKQEREEEEKNTSDQVNSEVEEKKLVVPQRKKKASVSSCLSETAKDEETKIETSSSSGKSCLSVPGISLVNIRNTLNSPTESVLSSNSEKSISDINIEMLELKSRRSSIDNRVLDHNNPTPLQRMIMLRQAGELFQVNENYTA
ncbi:DgyrCDS4657 [Dimorphilus gyrociliatus]|uniref:DgyrCDS4657 n=1 Tax=Dimorphilus gyrociliatus TaxID=2664684 RepID=A0A7I8VKA5_9ANNE|nr:DgyrCDS4657 [Dimorphilus gyrociliatus]